MGETQRNDIAVVIPALNRPNNVRPFMESLNNSTDLANAYWVCDPSDKEEIEAIYKNGGNIIINDTELKTFARKVNIGYAHTSEPWLLFVGDDVHFHPGWAEKALEAGKNHSFVATNDMGNPSVLAGLHATHPLIKRSWIDEHGASWDGPGTVAHEGYHHYWLDNEWTMVAIHAGEFIFAKDAKIEHLHPAFGKGRQDHIYILGQSKQNEDCRLFYLRKSRFHTRK